MSEKNETNRGKSRSGCRTGCRVLALLIGLVVVLLGIGIYKVVDNVRQEWKLIDEEADRKQAEREQEDHKKWVWEQVEKVEREAEENRQRLLREAEEKRQREIAAWRAEETLRQFNAQNEERARRKALEDSIAAVQSVPNEALEAMLQDASNRIAKLSIRPLEPMVLLQLVAVGVKAARKYARDKIFGVGPQEAIMKELVHESYILGEDRPEGEKKLILESVGESVSEWIRKQAG